MVYYTSLSLFEVLGHVDTLVELDFMHVNADMCRVGLRHNSRAYCSNFGNISTLVTTRTCCRVSDSHSHPRGGRGGDWRVHNDHSHRHVGGVERFPHGSYMVHKLGVVVPMPICNWRERYHSVHPQLFCSIYGYMGWPIGICVNAGIDFTHYMVLLGGSMPNYT